MRLRLAQIEGYDHVDMDGIVISKTPMYSLKLELSEMSYTEMIKFNKLVSDLTKNLK